MKLRLLILILLSSMPIILQASQLRSSGILKDLGIRPLIIFFDPYNGEEYKDDYGTCEELRTLWSEFKQALLDANVPIIASCNMWDNLVKCDYMKQLISDRWHVYAFRGSLIICIPRGGIYEEYLGKLNDFTVDHKNKAISDGQLLLGILLNLNSDQEITPSTSLPESKIESDLASALKGILLTRENITKGADKLLNRWDIFLSGHGGYIKSQGRMLAGMNLSSFSVLLDFLNTKINTRSLLYDTCYSGGESLSQPYQDIEPEMNMIREKKFNFTIMATTTFDSIIKVTKKPGFYKGSSIGTITSMRILISILQKLMNISPIIILLISNYWLIS